MIYELRIYTAAQGRMPDLLARFRDHTMTIFERHGMKNVGYWLNTVGGRCKCESLQVSRRVLLHSRKHRRDERSA